MQTAQSDDLATKMPGRDPVIGLLFSEQGSKFFFILRWIILVPASIALALLLQFSMLDSLESLLNEIGVFPDSIAFKVLFKISCILLGAIYIDIGMRIAPAYKKNAALVLLGFLLLIICIAFVQNEYGFAFNMSLVLLGGSADLLYIHKTGLVPKGIFSYSKKDTGAIADDGREAVDW